MTSDDSPNFEYCPPDEAAINEYARCACEQLAEQFVNPSWSHPDVIDGFSEFLKIVARICAKQLNGQLAHKNTI